MARFDIEFTPGALQELRAMRRVDAVRVLDAIEARLGEEPAVESRNRKRVIGAAPEFEHLDPVWELRIGDWRAFYDIDEEQHVITVRAAAQGSEDDRGGPVKIASVREVKARFSEYVAEAQEDRVIVTNHGRPVAVVIGIRGMDLESAVRASDPEFWALIQERRASTKPGNGVSLADVRRDLLGDEVPHVKRRRTRRRSS